MGGGWAGSAHRHLGRGLMPGPGWREKHGNEASCAGDPGDQTVRVGKESEDIHRLKTLGEPQKGDMWSPETGEGREN